MNKQQLIKKVTDWLQPPYASPATSDDYQILFEGKSEFHHISVVETGGCRTLFMGHLSQEAETSICVANPETPVFEYPGLMLLSLALGPQNRNILLLGLGGGFIPGLFQNHLHQHQLTVVELDPMVAELASTYFGFNPGQNVELKISDGLEYIARAEPESYDQIWLDAFGGEYIPQHLATADFLELCKYHLKPGGLLVQNLHQSRPTQYQQHLLRTIKSFGEVPLIFSGTRCANAVLMSQKDGGLPMPRLNREMVRAAKQFGPRIGAYDLLDEIPKLKKKGF